MNLEKQIIKKASGSSAWIVLPEAQLDDRVLQAGLCAVKKNICNIIFLGDDKLKKYESNKIKIINPEKFERKKEMINLLYEIRKHKKIKKSDAEKMICDNSYFAIMLLKMGIADGVVNGAVTSSRNVMKPALQIIKTRKGIDSASTFFIMMSKRNYVFADCALIENPTSEQLCDITIESAKSFEKITNTQPKVALVSYSTLGSGSGESVEKVQRAVSLLKKKRVKFEFSGEFQVDTALNTTTAKIKAPKSKIAGQCNVLIFPNLDSANIGYKLFQQASGCKAIGPIIQGLDMPVGDLSRGATINEIVLSIAITTIQSKNQRRK